MAVPTITNILPTSGPAHGGNIVAIVGTNFNTAYDTVAPYSNVIPVAVYFNDVAARSVMVISSTVIWAMAPGYTGQPDAASHTAVAIKVQNLDSDGDAVSGELALSSGAYTYLRPALAPSTTRAAKAGPTAQVLEAFIGRLQREILRNTAMQTALDYGEEGTIVVAQSSAPSIGIEADMVADPDWRQWDCIRPRKARAGGDGFDVHRPAKAYLFEFRLTLEAAHEAVYCRLRDVILETFEGYPYLDVPADPDWLPTTDNSYPIDPIEGFRQASNPSNLDYWACTVTVRVRGVRIMGQHPVDRAVVPTTTTLTVLEHS